VLVSTHYMDEAERCHRIAYLAFGRLLAAGTPEEIVQRSELTTWVVSGPGLEALAASLQGRPGVEMVTAFGATLHVSGRERARLDATIAELDDRPDLSWRRGAPTLEDTFIDLMTVEPGVAP